MSLPKDTEARERIAALEDLVRRLNEALGGALKRIEELEQAKAKPRSHFTR